MAYQSVWYITGLPKNIIDTISEDLFSSYGDDMQQSSLYGGNIDTSRRNSRNAWIPNGHWVTGFLWNYVNLANKSNFQYDIDCIDTNSLQYTEYREGEFYKWHIDAGINSLYKPKSTQTSGSEWIEDRIKSEYDTTRKLSIVMQLSDPEEYEGGNLQLLDEEGKTYFAPREKGTVIVFDSRLQHRVLKVTSGIRRSIVGWVVGPRWK